MTLKSLFITASLLMISQLSLALTLDEAQAKVYWERMPVDIWK